MRASRFKVSGRLLLIAAIALVGLMASLAVVGIGPRTTQLAGNGVIAIASGDIKPGKVRFYSYQGTAGDKIRFLLSRDQTGEVRAAMDACQRCYSFHKGYTASSDGYLICRLCGNRYKLSDKTLGIASCNPVKLPIRKVGDTVQVNSSDLERNRSMF